MKTSILENINYNPNIKLKDLESDWIEKALISYKKGGKSITEVAKDLGVSIATLYKKIRENETLSSILWDKLDETTVVVISDDNELTPEEQQLVNSAEDREFYGHDDYE